MSRIALHHPHGTDFDRFLYATVGADRNGYVVTVLSTLARLGLDPWKEASELGALSQDVARSRLGALLASFSDVPTLVLEHASTAERLTRLLPEHAHRPSESPGSLAARESSISRGTIITIVIILLLLAQIYGLGTSGTGD